MELDWDSELTQALIQLKLVATLGELKLTNIHTQAMQVGSIVTVLEGDRHDWN